MVYCVKNEMRRSNPCDDCFVVFVMSRGNSEAVVGVDNVSVKLSVFKDCMKGHKFKTMMANLSCYFVNVTKKVKKNSPLFIT